MGNTWRLIRKFWLRGSPDESLPSPMEDLLGIPEQDKVERQGKVAAYYKLSDEEVERLSTSKMPVVVNGRSGWRSDPALKPKQASEVYQLESVHQHDRNQFGTQDLQPTTRSEPEFGSRKLQRETEALMMSKVMPEFSRGKQAGYWLICWDSQTPTEDWLMCKHPHPQLSSLYLAVGGSFHSYKFVNPECESIL